MIDHEDHEVDLEAQDVDQPIQGPSVTPKTPSRAKGPRVTPKTPSGRRKGPPVTPPPIRTPMKRPRGDGGVAQSPVKCPRQQEDNYKSRIIFFKPSGAGQASTSKVSKSHHQTAFQVGQRKKLHLQL